MASAWNGCSISSLDVCFSCIQHACGGVLMHLPILDLRIQALFIWYLWVSYRPSSLDLRTENRANSDQPRNLVPAPYSDIATLKQKYPTLNKASHQMRIKAHTEPSGSLRDFLQYTSTVFTPPSDHMPISSAASGTACKFATSLQEAHEWWVSDLRCLQICNDAWLKIWTMCKLALASAALLLFLWVSSCSEK